MQAQVEMLHKSSIVLHRISIASTQYPNPYTKIMIFNSQLVIDFFVQNMSLSYLYCCTFMIGHERKPCSQLKSWFWRDLGFGYCAYIFIGSNAGKKRPLRVRLTIFFLFFKKKVLNNEAKDLPTESTYPKLPSIFLSLLMTVAIREPRWCSRLTGHYA
jgi:hypothetical protein